MASLAAPSQDLFFDYQMFGYALDRLGGQKPKKCVIEVAPYKLWYDMSLSKETQHRSLYYYPQTMTLHHFVADMDVSKEFAQMKMCYAELFSKDVLGRLWEISFKHFYGKKDTVILAEIDEKREGKYVSEVIRLFHKPYENTYRENLRILHLWLTECDELGIVPIFVMPPFPKVFTDNMNLEMYRRTNEVLDGLIEHFPGAMKLDFTYNRLFDDYYFSDWSHLNYWGANLLSDLLISHIERL